MTSSYSDVYDYLFKIIIIGDSGVGKSSILTRYTRNEFSIETKTTIGVELSTSIMNIENKKIKVAIWDTAGQERFRAACNLYYRNTLGAFIVFDITNYFSFQNVTKWLEELKQYVSGNLIITLIGNKSDLRHLRAVSKEDAQAFAEKHRMNYIETSALDSVNISPAFKDMVSNIYTKIYKQNDNLDATLADEQKKNFEKPKINLTISKPDSKLKAKKYECCKLS